MLWFKNVTIGRLDGVSYPNAISLNCQIGCRCLMLALVNIAMIC